ncbi:MAG: prenyltransferase [Desulfobacterales bacterium]
MKKIKAWIQASRLLSQSYIFLPVLLGQGYAVMESNACFDWPVFLWMVLFSLAIQLFIVYGNDYNDAEIDRLNRTFNLFSGGSRVLVEGILSRRELAAGIWIMAALNLFIGLVLTFAYHRYFALPIILLSMLLLYLYSFAPFRINYRGGGELLQMIGVACVLPLFGYYAQSNLIDPLQLPWNLVLVLLPFHLSSAVSTALPDYPSDKIGLKCTLAVILGLKRAKILIILLNFLSMILFVMIDWTGIAEPDTYTILLGPVIATLVMIFLIPRSDPGSLRLSAFVALNVVAVTILFNLMMIVHVF